MMATQRLIFIGFGMNDPFVYALLSYVSGDLWDKTGHVHYFITGISDTTQQDPYVRRRLLREDLGVQTIFYEVQGGDHSRLTDLLYALGANPSSETYDQPIISELLGPV